MDACLSTLDGHLRNSRLRTTCQEFLGNMVVPAQQVRQCNLALSLRLYCTQTACICRSYGCTWSVRHCMHAHDLNMDQFSWTCKKPFLVHACGLMRVPQILLTGFNVIHFNHVWNTYPFGTLIRMSAGSQYGERLAYMFVWCWQTVSFPLIAAPAMAFFGTFSWITAS